MEYLLIINAFLFLGLGILALAAIVDPLESIICFIFITVGIANIVAALSVMGYIIKTAP